MVLDHFIITVAPHRVKMTSPRAICLVRSYCLVVCGNKLERRRKEKKMKEYKAMNVTLCSRPADVAMTCCNVSIVRPQAILGTKGLLILIDFKRRGIWRS